MFSNKFYFVNTGNQNIKRKMTTVYTELKYSNTQAEHKSGDYLQLYKLCSINPSIQIEHKNMPNAYSKLRNVAEIFLK